MPSDESNGMDKGPLVDIFPSLISAMVRPYSLAVLVYKGHKRHLIQHIPSYIKRYGPMIMFDHRRQEEYHHATKLHWLQSSLRNLECIAYADADSDSNATDKGDESLLEDVN